MKEKVLKGIFGWMEDTEDASLEDLRDLRRDLGHDVDESGRSFGAFLTEQYRKLGLELKDGATNPRTASGKPFLGFVSDETGETPSRIEQLIGLPRQFLVQITQHANVVPERVRAEIAKRTVTRYPSLTYSEILLSLMQRSDRIAAARTTEFSSTEITFEQILTTSGLSEEEQDFWRGLSEEGEDEIR